MNFIKTYSPLDLSPYDFRTGKKFFPFRSLHYTSHFKPAEDYTKYSEQLKALPVPQRTTVNLRNNLVNDFRQDKQLNSNLGGSVRSANSPSPSEASNSRGARSLFVGTGKSICGSSC